MLECAPADEVVNWWDADWFSGLLVILFPFNQPGHSLPVRNLIELFRGQRNTPVTLLLSAFVKSCDQTQCTFPTVAGGVSERNPPVPQFDLAETPWALVRPLVSSPDVVRQGLERIEAVLHDEVAAH